MMPRPVYAALVVTLVACPAAAQSDPTNYDECILETMKGVSSDIAARAIIDSCRRLFPDAQEGTPEAAVAPAAASQSAPAQGTAAPAAASQAPPAQGSAVPAATAGAVATQVAEPAPDATPSAATASANVRELTKEELGKLESRGYFFGTSYRVKVHNGNDDLTLTELTIAVWDKDYIDGLETYRSPIDVPPLDEGSAKYTVVYQGEEETWAWKVVGAKGAE
jgi:hypothetical protein